jgi:hypothetical protein
MFSCKYCGVHYQIFHSICPSCGAPVHVETEEDATKREAQITADKIRRICDYYLNRDFSDNRDFKDGESISDKRMDTLRKSFRIFPIGKEIFLYCDATPLRTGKRGFLICEDGVYWQNTWTTPTTRNFINWDTFKKREIAHKKFDLHLGKGDVIDMSGLGGYELREKVAKFFKQIHDLLNEQSQEQK